MKQNLNIGKLITWKIIYHRGGARLQATYWLIGQDSYFNCICILANKNFRSCDPRCYVIQKCARRQHSALSIYPTMQSLERNGPSLAAVFQIYIFIHNPLRRFKTDLHERCNYQTLKQVFWRPYKIRERIRYYILLKNNITQQVTNWLSISLPLLSTRGCTSFLGRILNKIHYL